MITKSLSELENELAKTIQRISKITDLEDFYKAQRVILGQKEDERSSEVAPNTEKLLF